jgi:hypothetical protein
MTSRRAVVDASIWIDLQAADLIEAAFNCPFQWHCPDFIVQELRYPSGNELVAKGMHEEHFSGDEVVEIVELGAQYPKPGRRDLSAIVLAKRLECMVLTGDGALRKAAEKESVEVHGILWLLQSMVELGQIEPRRAADAVDQIIKSGGRLPRSISRRYQKKWRNSQRNVE